MPREDLSLEFNTKCEWIWMKGHSFVLLQLSQSHFDDKYMKCIKMKIYRPNLVNR